MNPKSPSYRFVPLSATQKGVVGQFAFLETALVTGHGQIEVYTPAADNEGRDAEVRRHLKSTPGIGIQVKVAFGMHKVDRRGRRTYMSVRFSIPETRVTNDPRLWYFLGVYDPHQLRLYDTCFLVPSAVLHKLSRYGKSRRGIVFVITANLAHGSRDRWSPHRVALSELGKRLLEIIDDAGLTAGAASLPLPAGAVVLGRIKQRASRSRRARAA